MLHPTTSGCWMTSRLRSCSGLRVEFERPIGRRSPPLRCQSRPDHSERAGANSAPSGALHTVKPWETRH